MLNEYMQSLMIKFERRCIIINKTFDIVTHMLVDLDRGLFKQFIDKA